MTKKTIHEDLEQKIESLEKEISLLQQNEVSLNKFAKNNEAMLRISMALPEYPDLEELLDYVSSEIKGLIDTQGALVILLDEERQELFFLGAAYDDKETKERVKEFRFPVNAMASGKVIKTGEPIIVNDTSKDLYVYPGRDKKFGHHFRNYVLAPIKSSDRTIGVLAAYNKTLDIFEQADMELLEMIAGTVALSIENARFSGELKKAYRELTSLDRAKDKAMNHLSHELKTPVSIFSGTLNVLTKKLETLPEQTWKNTMERAHRNLDRIREIQGEVDDIIQEKNNKSHDFFSFIVDQCSDLLGTIITEELGESTIVGLVEERINEIFDNQILASEKIMFDDFIKERLENLEPLFAHRKIEINCSLNSKSSIYIPKSALQKTIDGLIKNGIENTPDHGKIEIKTKKTMASAELMINDFGIGIIKEHQRRIFEGFFSTQEIVNYSSKNSFDFNAGGRGADLLRMKIFSKRYNFKISMTSSRCRFIPNKNDQCPGNIMECSFCKKNEDCCQSGNTLFHLTFPITKDEFNE